MPNNAYNKRRIFISSEIGRLSSFRNYLNKKYQGHDIVELWIYEHMAGSPDHDLAKCDQGIQTSELVICVLKDIIKPGTKHEIQSALRFHKPIIFFIPKTHAKALEEELTLLGVSSSHSKTYYVSNTLRDYVVASITDHLRASRTTRPLLSFLDDPDLSRLLTRDSERLLSMVSSGNELEARKTLAQMRSKSDKTEIFDALEALVDRRTGRIQDSDAKYATLLRNTGNVRYAVQLAFNAILSGNLNLAEKHLALVPSHGSNIPTSYYLAKSSIAFQKTDFRLSLQFIRQYHQARKADGVDANPEVLRMTAHIVSALGFKKLCRRFLEEAYQASQEEDRGFDGLFLAEAYLEANLTVRGTYFSEKTEFLLSAAPAGSEVSRFCPTEELINDYKDRWHVCKSKLLYATGRAIEAELQLEKALQSDSSLHYVASNIQRMELLRTSKGALRSQEFGEAEALISKSLRLLGASPTEREAAAQVLSTKVFSDGVRSLVSDHLEILEEALREKRPLLFLESIISSRKRSCIHRRKAYSILIEYFAMARRLEFERTRRKFDHLNLESAQLCAMVGMAYARADLASPSRAFCALTELTKACRLLPRDQAAGLYDCGEEKLADLAEEISRVINVSDADAVLVRLERLDRFLLRKGHDLRLKGRFMNSLGTRFHE